MTAYVLVKPFDYRKGVKESRSVVARLEVFQGYLPAETSQGIKHRPKFNRPSYVSEGTTHDRATHFSLGGLIYFTAAAASAEAVRFTTLIRGECEPAFEGLWVLSIEDFQAMARQEVIDFAEQREP